MPQTLCIFSSSGKRKTRLERLDPVAFTLMNSIKPHQNALSIYKHGYVHFRAALFTRCPVLLHHRERIPSELWIDYAISYIAFSVVNTATRGTRSWQVDLPLNKRPRACCEHTTVYNIE